MADPRKPHTTILLKKSGKTTQICLYDFAQFSEQKEDEEIFRVRIDGRWHCPDSKYSALGPDAVTFMLGKMLFSEHVQEERPDGLDDPVRVFAHWDPKDDMDHGCGSCWTVTPPFLGLDGRWWIWVSGKRMVRCDDVRILSRHER